MASDHDPLRVAERQARNRLDLLFPIIRRFRKKPVVIEACRNPGYEDQARCVRLTEWCGGSIHLDGSIDISTMEGVMKAMPGDWIIKGVHGEFYPCKPDIFEQTYEEVEGGMD